MSLFSLKRNYEKHIFRHTFNNYLNCDLPDRLIFYKRAKVKSLGKDSKSLINHVYYCYIVE